MQIIHEKKEEKPENLPFKDKGDLKDVAADVKAELEMQYYDMELPRAWWMEELDMSMNDLYVDLAMCMKPERHSKAQCWKEIGLKDIFLSDDSGLVPQRVLIDGAAGFGKTTLAFKIAFDWAHHETYLNQFEFVIVIQLRQWENQAAEDIIADATNLQNVPKEEVLNLLSAKQDQVVLVLDGYDELSQAGKEAVMPLLTGQRFARMTIIVTCRHGASLRSARTRPNKLCPELVKKLIWNKYIQIRGIRKENQRHFLELYLSPKKLEAVSERINLVTSPETEGLFDSPLFLLLWATLLEEDHVNIPQNETDLYKSLFNWMIGRSLIRENILVVDEGFDLFDERQVTYEFVRKLLVNFGALALCSLAENTLLLTERDILDCCQDDGRILKFGFLSSNIRQDMRKKKYFYEPIHKTILEFIAAYSLVWRFINGSAEEFSCCVVVYSDVLFDDFTLVLPFLVGLLGRKVFLFLQRLECIGFAISQCFSRLQDILYRNDQVSENVALSLARYSPAVTDRDVSGKDDFLKSKFHRQLLRFGVQSQRIKVVRVFSTQMTLPADLAIPCLRLGDTVLQNQPDSAEEFVKFVFSCNATLRWFNVTNYHESFLPVLCKFLSSGSVDPNRRLDRLRCECNNPERFPLVIQVLQTNMVKALDLTIAALTQTEINKFLSDVGTFKSLDEFHLWNNDSQTNISINLNEFAGEKRSFKVWKRLGFEGKLVVEVPTELITISTEEFRVQSCDSLMSASSLNNIAVLDVDLDDKSLHHLLTVPTERSGFRSLLEFRLKIGLLKDNELILRTISRMCKLEVLHLSLNYTGRISDFLKNVCNLPSYTNLRVIDIDCHEYDLDVICSTAEEVTELLSGENHDGSLQGRSVDSVNTCCLPQFHTLGLNFSYVKGEDSELVKLVDCLISCLEKGVVSKLYISAPNIYSSDVFRKWLKSCLLHKNVTVDFVRRGCSSDDTRLRKWEFDRDWYSPPEAFMLEQNRNSLIKFGNK